MYIIYYIKIDLNGIKILIRIRNIEIVNGKYG